jgi:hypothetical protein
MMGKPSKHTTTSVLANSKREKACMQDKGMVLDLRSHQEGVSEFGVMAPKIQQYCIIQYSLPYYTGSKQVTPGVPSGHIRRLKTQDPRQCPRHKTIDIVGLSKGWLDS